MTLDINRIIMESLEEINSGEEKKESKEEKKEEPKEGEKKEEPKEGEKKEEPKEGEKKEEGKSSLKHYEKVSKIMKENPGISMATASAMASGLGALTLRKKLKNIKK